MPQILRKHFRFPPRNQARLSSLGRRALFIWAAEYDGDVSGTFSHVLNGGATRKAHSISCDGVDDYVLVATITDSRLAGAASVTAFIDVILGEFDTNPSYGWLDHIYDNGGTAATQIFNLMAEDNAVSVGFWGVRLITTKGDLQIGDRIRVAYRIVAGDTTTTTIYINGIKQAWTIEGGTHQIQNFLSTWKMKLCGQDNGTSITNFGKHEVFSCALFPEAISDDEMQQLTEDPVNTLFLPRYRWLPTSGSSVVLLPGSFTVSGQPATFTAASVVGLLASAWGWTANAVSFVAATVILMGITSWNWAAKALAFSAATVFQLTAATFVWSALAVGFSASVILSLASAVWSWTAQVVTLGGSVVVGLASAAWGWTAKGLSLSGMVAPISNLVRPVVRGLVRKLWRRR